MSPRKSLLVLYLVTQSCPTLCGPMDCDLPGSSDLGDSPGKDTEVGCHILLHGDLPCPGIKPTFPSLQMDSLPSAPQGKPKNTEWVAYPSSRGAF